MKAIGTGLHHADFHFRSLESSACESGFAFGAKANAYANEGESVKTGRKKLHAQVRLKEQDKLSVCVCVLCVFFSLFELVDNC